MIRATTPKQLFYFESDPSVYQKILVTYAQNGSIVLEKGKEDLTFEVVESPCHEGEEAYLAWFRMTQEETNLFKEKKAVLVQVRVLTEDGEALASEKRSIGVDDVLNDEVLS